MSCDIMPWSCDSHVIPGHSQRDLVQVFTTQPISDCQVVPSAVKVNTDLPQVYEALSDL